MDPKTYQRAVNGIERLLGDHQLSREEILCVLAKVTTNAIHVNEERLLRMRIELEYIRALGRFSAEEEKKQLYSEGGAPKHHDFFITKMVGEIHACLAVEWDT